MGLSVTGKLLLMVSLTAAASAGLSATNSELDGQWETYKQDFNKNYATSDEEIRRRQIWQKNLELIAKHNREYEHGLHKFTLGINRFADMELGELSSRMSRFKREETQIPKPVEMFVKENFDADLPDTVDWRDKGYVTEVKDQGQCGGCWAFSATGALEGQHFKATGELVSLSEEDLVDCCTLNDGCDGGTMEKAFECVKEANGIDTESYYPYTAGGSGCKYNPEFSGATVKGFSSLPEGDEEALKAAVANIGPISAGFDASSIFFQLYNEGVYSGWLCSPEGIDHGILIVGYGTEDGEDYWLIKNSWGTSWGQNGFGKMSRNNNNNCGIAQQTSYPIV